MGGAGKASWGAFSQPQLLVPFLTVMAFGLLPLLDARIAAVWSLIPILVVLVAMVIEFT